MRILFVTPWYPSTEHTYLGAFIREQSRAVARHGDVRVIAPRLTRRPRRLMASVDSLTDDEPLAARPVARFLLPRRVSWGNAAGAFTDAARRALAAWQAEGWTPDVIHGHNLLPGGWTTLELGRELGVPSVVTVHSSFVSQPVLTRSSESRVRATMSGVDALIAVGPTVVQELVGIEPGCAPRLIPNLVDDVYFTPPPEAPQSSPGDALRIIGIGALIPAKRYHLLLEAVADLYRRGTWFRLTLVGDGPERQRLETQAGQLGIGELVRFTGGLDRAGVRDELWRADVLVHPSRYETFGVVLVEAMACGLPVIATRSGGPEWVVEPVAGELVGVDDVAALSISIGRIASGQRTYDAANIRKRAVERFGAQRVSGELAALYRELPVTTG